MLDAKCTVLWYRKKVIQWTGNSRAVNTFHFVGVFSSLDSAITLMAPGRSALMPLVVRSPVRVLTTTSLSV